MTASSALRSPSHRWPRGARRRAAAPTSRSRPGRAPTRSPARPHRGWPAARQARRRVPRTAGAARAGRWTGWRDRRSRIRSRRAGLKRRGSSEAAFALARRAPWSRNGCSGVPTCPAVALVAIDAAALRHRAPWWPTTTAGPFEHHLAARTAAAPPRGQRGRGRCAAGPVHLLVGWCAARLPVRVGTVAACGRCGRCRSPRERLPDAGASRDGASPPSASQAATTPGRPRSFADQVARSRTIRPFGRRRR